MRRQHVTVQQRLLWDWNMEMEGWGGGGVRRLELHGQAM